MAEQKSVTLTKGNRKVTLTVPRDIVEYKAAGWREEGSAKRSHAAAPKPAEVQATSDEKGGAKK